MIDRLTTRLPKTSERWLSIVVLLAIAYFARADVVEVALGAIAGGLIVWIWTQPPDADVCPRCGWDIDLGGNPDCLVCAPRPVR